jgi:HEAT repeat protein
VVEALLQLFSDPDPNVRAVAAISLGRTGRSEEYIIDALIKLLEDGDRIVRQSACLSLGTLKAVKAIPHIGNIWYAYIIIKLGIGPRNET